MLVLRLLLLLFVIEVNNSLELIITLILRKYELVDKPVFTDHDALLIDDIVELTIVLLEDIVFVVFFILIVLKVMVAGSAVVTLNIIAIFTLAVLTLKHVRLSLALLLTVLVVELLQDILDLTLKLVIYLIH